MEEPTEKELKTAAAAAGGARVERMKKLACEFIDLCFKRFSFSFSFFFPSYDGGQLSDPSFLVEYHLPKMRTGGGRCSKQYRQYSCDEEDGAKQGERGLA